ncbi:alpha/beta fold hydrolase [Micromonospora sp. WMMD882]|uniref:thioesterase II family protein n=1 Tax=Micromonospora sp. WMMD882 TaxID=3015151 RepID=UPI00248B1B1C|nr:alpha/beta fold hydrolase [Micromonospora sp. WMMD882]WBB78065.1 alpha/beta fold hydrolase [Micromonospora sp. WMMD882]
MPASPSVLVPIGRAPESPSVTLVLFAGAGAGPGYFREWVAAAPPGWAFLAVNLPGRGGRFREPFATSLDALATELAEAVAALPTERVVLFGHSFGALLAMEVARRMPQPPALLATAGNAPPDVEPFAYSTKPTHEDDLRLARGLLGQLAAELSGPVLEEMVEITAPICRADMDLLVGCRRPAEPLPCDIVAFYAEHDFSPPESWADVTAGRADTVVLPGEHITFCQVARDDILAHLRSRLALV